MKLSSTPKFEKAYRKFVSLNSLLQKKIDRTLRQMESDIFSPSLETNKLSGKLAGLFACSCGYDCRIIFSLVQIFANTPLVVGWAEPDLSYKADSGPQALPTDL